MKINTISEIEKSLKKVKLQQGSSCLLHSSLINFGLIKNVPTNSIPKTIFELINKRLGKRGTLSAVTPDYNYVKKNVSFDIKTRNVAREFGTMSEFICKHSGSYRSLNPLFNTSSVGKNAKFITSGNTPSAFGEDSAWDRLFKLNSEILFLGCDISICTFIRFIEFRFGVPYLYNKFFNKKIYSNNKIFSRYSTSFLRYKHCLIEYDLSNFRKLLLKKKVLRLSENGVDLKVLSMQACYEIGIEALKKDVFFFLKKKPKFKKKMVPLI